LQASAHHVLSKRTPLRICLATSELTPLAKTGGLADVCSALSAYLHRAGHDVRVLLPRYSIIDSQGLDIVPVDYLQRIPMRIGEREGHFSIDTVQLPGSSLGIYLVRCPELYDRDGIYTSAADEYLRFILLSRAAIEMCQHMGFAPDVFHCHDWHTGLIPLYLKSTYAWDRLFANTRSVLTIHNIGYQGVFNASILSDLGLDGAHHMLHQDDLGLGRINFLKTGVLHAHLLTTVSPTYAREIQGEEYGMGLQDLLRSRSDTLVGILNGVDYREWNPETDPLIPARYSRTRLAGKGVCKRELMKDLGLAGGVSQPVIGMVTRLTAQKGIDLIRKVLPPLLQRRSFALAVLGSGEARYERFFSWLQENYSDRVCFYRGFNNKLAHWIEAGSDMFLMTSRFEPCGLNQMYSRIYGTVPIVRRTGGLADTVELWDPDTRKGSGVVFDHPTPDAVRWALETALDLYEDTPAWKELVKNAMDCDFSWDTQVPRYLDAYARARAGSRTEARS
jgi:starch synthase